MSPAAFRRVVYVLLYANNGIQSMVDEGVNWSVIISHKKENKDN